MPRTSEPAKYREYWMMICSWVTKSVRKITRGEKTEKPGLAVVQVRTDEVGAGAHPEPGQRQVGHLGAELELLDPVVRQVQRRRRRS